MRLGFALAALLLPLAGCVVPPQPVGYGYVPQPVGYGYAPQPEYGYPGYAYNNGAPTLVVEGATVPLIYFGGSWGYYDGYRQFHRAPDNVYRQLEQRHPGGVGYHPYAGGGYGRPVGGYPGAYPGGYRPGGPVVGPGGYHPGGPVVGPGGYHPGGTVAGPGYRPPGQPGVQRAATPAFGPRAIPTTQARSAQPERHRQDDHR